MKKAKFSIVIRVRDLDLCRGFYRDVLNLGEPMADSGFAVIFRLSPDLLLTLEKSQASYLEHSSSATSWCLPIRNQEELISRLVDAGYSRPETAIRIGERDCLRCLDPEGNVFYVREADSDCR